MHGSLETGTCGAMSLPGAVVTHCGSLGLALLSLVLARSRSLSHTLSYDFRPEQKEEAIKLLFALLVKWDVHCAAWAALFQGAEVTGDPLGQGPRSVFELFIKGRVCVKWEIELKHKHTHPATKC